MDTILKTIYLTLDVSSLIMVLYHCENKRAFIVYDLCKWPKRFVEICITRKHVAQVLLMSYMFKKSFLQ